MNQPVEQTFPALVRDLSGPLTRYLLRYTGDAALTKDLVQETLARMARGLAAFDGRASVKTWAFTIASRVAADHFRKPEHRVRVVAIDEAADMPASDRDADEQIVVDEMNACVRQVIDTLPDDYRAALVLRDLEGLTAEETAEITGCTLAAAKIRIHRARARLRQALWDQCDFYRDRENVFRCERK